MSVVATGQAQPALDSKQKMNWTSAKAIFLTWAPLSHSRRSRLMATRLDIPLVTIHALKHKRSLAPLRYIIQAVQTLVTLVRLRPKIIFVQNPPIFAVLFAYLYCVMGRAQFIIDSHTGAFSKTWDRFLTLQKFLAKKAIVTFVTNEHLRDIVVGWGGKAYIIRDIPSNFPTGNPAQFQHPFNVVMISTYAPDEPLEVVLEVAASLPQVGFYITGNPNRAYKPLPKKLPDNVYLTGYLSEEDYYGLLRSAQVVMALTTTDHTMQRGACEAVWLGKPLITSNWPLLQEFFHAGTLHVDNSFESIRESILRIQIEENHLAQEMKDLQLERRQLWQQWIAEISDMILKAEGC